MKQLVTPTLATGRQDLVHPKGKEKELNSPIKSKKMVNIVMIVQPTLLQVIMETMRAMLMGR
jgi:hypothetical protein